jgi:hypothetical protein
MIRPRRGSCIPFTLAVGELDLPLRILSERRNRESCQCGRRSDDEQLFRCHDPQFSTKIEISEGVLFGGFTMTGPEDAPIEFPHQKKRRDPRKDVDHEK